MVQPGQITFYTHAYSPYGHRVHIALEEAKAKYTTVSINLMDKPVWYATKINLITGKIPAITWGGPEHPPEEPSPEATKLIESNIIVEFLADAFPESGLIPVDPVQRAKARFFINIVDTKVFEGYAAFFFKPGSSADALLNGFEVLQSLLPETGFAVGQFSIADVAMVALFVRIKLLLANEIGKYPLGEGKKTLDALGQLKFARFTRYIDDVMARPSFQATWDEAVTLHTWQMNPYTKRD